MIFFFLNFKKKKSLLVVSNLVFLFYALCALLCLFVLKIDYPNYKLSFKGVSVFTGTLILFLIPFYIVKDNDIKIKIDKNKIISFSVFFATIGMISALYFSQYIFNVFNANIAANRRAMVLGYASLINPGFFNTLMGAFGAFYHISFILFFVLLSFKIGNFYLRLALFLSTLSEPFHVFAYYGRDGVFTWLVCFLFCYVVFFKYLSKKQIKLINLVFFSLSFIFLFLVMIISYYRFGENILDMFWSIVKYFGQSLYNYDISYSLFNKFHFLNYGKTSFPLLYDILGIDRTIAFDNDVSSTFLWSGEIPWVFGTFLKSWLFEFGVFGTIFIGLCIALFFKKNIKGSINIDSLLLLFLYYIFLMQGWFYFRMSTNQYNLMILGSIFFFYVLRFSKIIIKND